MQQLPHVFHRRHQGVAIHLRLQVIRLDFRLCARIRRKRLQPALAFGTELRTAKRHTRLRIQIRHAIAAGGIAGRGEVKLHIGGGQPFAGFHIAAGMAGARGQ